MSPQGLRFQPRLVRAKPGVMLPLTGYVSEMRHLRQGPVDGSQRESLRAQNQAPVAAESLNDKDPPQRWREARESVFVLPQGEQSHKSRIDAIPSVSPRPYTARRGFVVVGLTASAAPSRPPGRGFWKGGSCICPVEL